MSIDLRKSERLEAEYFITVRVEGASAAQAFAKAQMTNLSQGGVCFIFPDQSVSCTYVGFDAVFLIEVLPGPFAEVAVGRDHACGLRPDGSIACWGRDDFGEATPPK
jgi:hypothetical protein